MSKKEKQNETPQQEPAVEEQDVKREVAAEPEETAVDPLLSELESLKDQVAGQEDKYLRLAAEYDNYRKRTAKENESSLVTARYNKFSQLQNVLFEKLLATQVS